MKKLSKNKIAIPTILIGIFLLTLFLTTYFNYTSGIAINPDGTTIGTKYFLSGPDSYYNLRLCEETLKTGDYPFVSPWIKDPMLNYPLGGKGVRPPLFNFMAIFSTSILENFMPHIDAFGLSMLFLPAIYGSLMIFPVYNIGRDLFNKKVGLISALLISLIPIHIGGSHGSSLSLFDHDSFLYLLSAILIMFFIKSLRSNSQTKSILHASLAGLTLGAIYLTWTSARFFFAILMIYIAIQFLIDIIRLDKQTKPYTTIITASLIALTIALPFMLQREEPFAFPLILLAFSTLIFTIKQTNIKLKLPWLISLPIIGAITGISLTYFYLISTSTITAPIPTFNTIASNLFGGGIYGGKISTTIAEASSFNISQTVMSFGISLYWFAILGIILYFYQSNKDKYLPHNIFFLSMILIYMWLSTSAGRFVNDLVPFIAIFGAYFIFSILDKINYKEWTTAIRYSGGGIKNTFTTLKVKHIAGILIITFLLILPNAYMSLDAAVPGTLKEEVFGDNHQGAYGLSLGKSIYWSEACHWLSQQDTHIANPEDRPAVISWWDYGFYLSATSKHPTVADNFQEGIPPAANFLTSQSEEEAIIVLSIRLIEGEKEITQTGDIIVGKLTSQITNLIKSYFPQNHTLLISILEDPITHAPSYNSLISPEYGNTQLRVTAKNAMYHDATKIILQNLNENSIIHFYKSIRTITNNSIEYFATEAYDQQIFGIFPYLGDKGTFRYSTLEDDFYASIYIDKHGNTYNMFETTNMTRAQMEELELRESIQQKPAYYNSMWYRTWHGIKDINQRLPTVGLKHFYLSYISHYVVIAKYYEGCPITGTITINNTINYPGPTIYVTDNYGISHDATITTNGTFNLIAPAGNNSLKVLLGNTILKEQHFIPTISEAEAKRDINSTIPHININFNYSHLTININNTYNSTTLNINSTLFPTYTYNFTNLEDPIKLEELIPDYYIITLLNSTGIQYTDTIFIHPNQNNYTIT